MRRRVERCRAIRIALTLAFVAACSVPAAFAQTVPPVVGGDLLRSCNALIAIADKGGDISVDATSCAAYLKGLRDAIDAQPVRTPTERLFCAGGVGLDDMARTVVKDLQERPESARRHAANEALAALGRAYPCKK